MEWKDSGRAFDGTVRVEFINTALSREEICWHRLRSGVFIGQFISKERFGNIDLEVSVLSALFFTIVDGSWNMQQRDVERVQEFRKCIECFLCQDVCHVLREHYKHDEFIGPRLFVYTAALEMHPLDEADRLPQLKETQGIGYCNITKCCTKVCPEFITIADDTLAVRFDRGCSVDCSTCDARPFATCSASSE